MPMNVLFCSDALIADGAASFVFHLSAALARSGTDAAVLGGWAGKGLQSRLRKDGVRVNQRLFPTVGNVWHDRKAGEFAPDAILTGSRRSFPPAARSKAVAGAKVLTFLPDSLEKTDRGGPDADSPIRCSDAWRAAEPPLPKGSGTVVVREHPELIPRETLNVCENRDHAKMEESGAFLWWGIEPRFERENAPDEFRSIVNELGVQPFRGSGV
jgi:hypothetical protein